MKKTFLLALWASSMSVQANGYRLCVEQKDPHTELAMKIAIQEGFFAKPLNKQVTLPLPARLHNPGSLVYAGQPHAKKHKSGFALFDSDKWGWVALEKDLAKKLREGRSLTVAWEYL